MLFFCPYFVSFFSEWTPSLRSYTPPFFFILVRTRLRYFLCPFHLGSHSQIFFLKLLIAIPDCATRLTKSFIIRIASMLAPKTTQNQVLGIKTWAQIIPKTKKLRLPTPFPGTGELCSNHFKLGNWE